MKYIKPFEKFQEPESNSLTRAGILKNEKKKKTKKDTKSPNSKLLDNQDPTKDPKSNI